MNLYREALACIDQWPEGTDADERLDQVLHFTAWCLSERCSDSVLCQVVALVARHATGGYDFATELYALIGPPEGLELTTKEAEPFHS